MATPTYVPFTRSGTNILPPNHYMTIGQQLVSPNGQYKLILQSDSNLALYDGASAIWAANSDQPYSADIYGKSYGETRFFVSNSAFLEDSLRGRLWTASTGKTEDRLWYSSHMSVQNDGNIVTVDIDAIFTSRTVELLPNSTDVQIVPPGTSLEVGRAYYAGGHHLIFQTDGNMVLYTNEGAVVWHTDTYGQGGTQAIMQSDGNFVIYNAQGAALWQTHTGGNPGAYAQIQSNGAFVICNSAPLWARFGWAPGKAPNVFYPDHSTGPLPTYRDFTYPF